MTRDCRSNSPSARITRSLRALCVLAALALPWLAAPAEAGPRNPTLDEYYAWTVLRNQSQLRDNEWSREFKLWLDGYYDALDVVTSKRPTEQQAWHVICYAKPSPTKEIVPGRILNVIKNSFRNGDWENIRQIRFAEAALSVLIQSYPCSP